MKTLRLTVASRRVLAAALLTLLLGPLAPRTLLAQEPIVPDGAADMAAIAWPEDDMLAPGAGEDPALGAREGAIPLEPPETPAAPDGELAIATLFDGSALEPQGGPQEPSNCGDGDCLLSSASVEMITPLDARLIYQHTPGMLGGSEANDHFGDALLSADFNGDGADEVVVGVPLEDLGLADVGVVYVIPGRPDSSIAGVQLFAQDSAGVPGVGEAGDHFGAALAAGDFDGNGFPDLAISAPGESDGAIAEAGAVIVLYGGQNGLTAAGAQIFTQQTAGIPDVSETGDAFGSALAAGDFNNDGQDDLAIGAQREPWLLLDDAGQVTILYGKAGAGLDATTGVVFSQATVGIAGAEEVGDLFGRALASGNFDGDAYADLAVSAPYEDHGALSDAGVVHILHGSAAGITAAGSAFLHQDVVNIIDSVEALEYYGNALAAGDSNGDGRDELFVGVPGEDLPGEVNAGTVQILTRVGATYQSYGLPISRLSQGVVGSPVANELFGSALAAGDFDVDSQADLVIGNARMLVSGQAEAGGVTVLHNLGGLINEYVGQNYTLDSFGIPGNAVTNDHLGGAVAVGDFNGDLKPDLATGIADRNYLAVTNAGAILLLFNERQTRVMLPMTMR